MKIPVALDDLAPRGRGRRLYRAVCREFEVPPDAFEVLAEACRMVDELDRLAEIVELEGLTITTDKGETRVHPAQIERRLLRAELRLALTKLGFEDEEMGETASSRRARRAAEKRWGMA